MLYILVILSIHSALAALDNKGTEFILGFMDNKASSEDVKPELFITTSKSRLVHVKVTAPRFPKANINQSFGITDGQVHYLQIDPRIRLHSTEVSSKAILIQADDEISVYGVNRERHSNDAYLGLPTDALGKEYYTVSYTPATQYTVFLVIGVQDGTNVSMRLSDQPHVNVTYQNATYMGGQWINVTMNRFDTLEINSKGDLTGTHIISDKPVSVLSGNKKTSVGSGSSQDHLVEQLLPVQSWGKHFATLPIPNRVTGDIFRLVASQDQTTVNVTGIDAGKPFHDKFVIKNAGSYVQKHYSSHLYSYVTSDKPLQLLQYAVTQRPKHGDQADPSMITVTPVEQYATDYTFTTPRYTHGNYSNFFMFVVKNSEKTGLLLDGKPLRGNHIFHHIPGTHLVAGHVKVSPGTHTVKHTSPSAVIGGIVFGKANIESYGFPVGLLLSPINSNCTAQKMTDGDEIDNDCDGQIDEEICNGEDDDGDGRIDEDCAEGGVVIVG